jgi:putative chitinase
MTRRHARLPSPAVVQDNAQAGPAGGARGRRGRFGRGNAADAGDVQPAPADGMDFWQQEGRTPAPGPDGGAVSGPVSGQGTGLAPRNGVANGPVSPANGPVSPANGPTSATTPNATPSVGRYVIKVASANLMDTTTTTATGVTLAEGVAVDASEQQTLGERVWLHVKAAQGEGWLPRTQLTAVTTPIAASAIDAAKLQAAVAAAVAVAPTTIPNASTGIDAIVREAANLGEKNADRVAYLLATAEHESRLGEVMVEQSNGFHHNQKTGKWSARVHTNGRTVRANSEADVETAYWDSAYGGRNGNERGTTDGRDFRGRGYAQITGRDNYRRMSQILNAQGFSYTADGQTWGGEGNTAIDLTANPTHVNTVPALAARLLAEGSLQGDYTGRALSDDIRDGETPDFFNARAVINGDKNKVEDGQTKSNGERIADIARRYAAALGPVWAAVFVAPAAPAPTTRT